MKSFAVVALALIFAPAILAQHQTFAVNPDASEVKIKLNTTHEVVNGTFHIQSGSINFDRAASHISGTVIVAAGSGKTGNDSRDKKMNKDILKAEQFGTVSFAPKSYSGTVAASGDSTIQVSGVFTLLGTDHDLTIPMQFHQLAITVIMEPRRAVVAVPDTRNWVRSLNASDRFDGSASYDRGLSGASCPLWSVVPACWRFVIWWQLVTA
ncbi:MAG TPA: YceI family protein [Candidatus Sulfotelmatobacter sp.]